MSDRRTIIVLATLATVGVIFLYGLTTDEEQPLLNVLSVSLSVFGMAVLAVTKKPETEETEGGR